MVQKQKIQDGAKTENTENTSVLHDEPPHGGGSRRRQPPCGEGWPKASPLHVARKYFQHFPSLVFSAGPIVCFPLWPILFCISGPTGTNDQCFSASL